MVTRHDPRVKPGIVTRRRQVFRFALGGTTDLDEFAYGMNEGQSTVIERVRQGSVGTEGRSNYLFRKIVSAVFYQPDTPEEREVSPIRISPGMMKRVDQR